MGNSQQHTHCLKDEKPTFQQMAKYVRVRSAENSRFVEFDFAISDPSLFVELVLPKKAFEQFCQANDVVFMSQEQQDANDTEMEKWRYGEDTLMAKNRNEQHSQVKNAD
ncbi:MAG: phenol hydroxylase subunit [Colwellia sp.]|nr:phenol hydroxylase subunit [Colwellia sp.]